MDRVADRQLFRDLAASRAAHTRLRDDEEDDEDEQRDREEEDDGRQQSRDREPRHFQRLVHHVKCSHPPNTTGFSPWMTRTPSPSSQRPTTANSPRSSTAASSS